MSSRDLLRADLDLRAYGPCHRRDCSAGTPELLPQITQPGLGTISDDYGPAATCRSMDLAADGTDDYATAGSGPTRQSGARDSELPQAPVDVAYAMLLAVWSRRFECKHRILFR